MPAQIKIEGLDKLTKKLDELAKMKLVGAAIKASALHVKGKIAKYPRRKSVSIQQVGGWKSEKQRRWFFAALRSGQIQVPYRRTMALQHRWTIKTRDNGLTAIVGNNTPYGPYVQSEAQQTRMHQTIGWKTTETVASEEGARVNELIAQAIEKALAG